MDVLLRLHLLRLVDSLSLLCLGVDHAESAASQDAAEHKPQQQQAAKTELDYLSHEIDAEYVVSEPEFRGD